MNNVTYQPTLCVGADVHLDEIVLRAVDKALGHEVLERFSVTNNLPGAQQAAATIAAAATALGYTRIEIACEATGMLWIPFHRYLSTAPPLQPFDLELVCFNPKLVAKFKDGLVLRSPKDDDRDAFDIAARLRFGELPISYVPSDFWQGLRRLTRYREHPLDQSWQRLRALLLHPGRQPAPLAQVSRSVQVSAQTCPRPDGAQARASGACPAHEE